MAWTKGRARERVVRVVPVTTCPCQDHCGTLTVSVYPLDRRSDAGRGEGVTIGRPCWKFRTKNEPWTTVSRSFNWSPLLPSPIVTTITPGFSLSPTSCPTTIRRSVDNFDGWSMRDWNYWSWRKNVTERTSKSVSFYGEKIKEFKDRVNNIANMKQESF